MGTMKLNAEEFSGTYAVINKASNTAIVNAMQDIASVLKPHEGDNEVISQAYANCRKLADSYNNGFYESLVGIKKTYDELFDLSEYMDKKANVGDVSSADTSFESGKLDASKVMV